MSQPRRRRDDWKENSGRKLRTSFFEDMAVQLGYDPARVMSVRVNPREAVITFRGATGMPHSVRHELVDE